MLNKQVCGKEFKKDSSYIVAFFDNLTPEERKALSEEFKTNN